MLGSAGEADDAVQEAWLRLSRSDTAEVENMRGWLTTVVSRICLDMLRARQSRREDLVDEWSLTPVVALFDEDEGDPEHEALIADGVGLALLVVLDTLSPAERLAFVLHDMFGVPFEEIAPIVDRNAAAARQLASRARRRVRGATSRTRRASLSSARSSTRSSRRRATATSTRCSRCSIRTWCSGPRPAPTGPPVPARCAARSEVANAVLARGRPFAHLGRPAIVNGRAGRVRGASPIAWSRSSRSRSSATA